MIEIDHLSRRFGGQLAVDDVSMTIERGSITVIVGTSGSGKSTTLRMINRLIEPSDGTIRIDGVDTKTLQPDILRRRIGYVIQGHGLFPHWTVARNIAAVPHLLGWDKARIEKRVSELLTLFQLDPALYAGKFPHELSGGQQQRVGVARGLAAEPEVLLMDEPFGALDPVIRAKAQEDLLAIHERFGTTIVLVTHDMEEAVMLADRIAVMDGGKLLQYDRPEAILGAPAAGFVEQLIANGERPFRLLSLAHVADVTEPGTAEGTPITATTNLRDALSQLIWTRREVTPVVGSDGIDLGIVRLARVLAEAGCPQ